MRQEIAQVVDDTYSRTMPPGGRRKPPERKRNERIVVMVTAVEKELFRSAADKTDLEFSQWVRQVLFAEARRSVELAFGFDAVFPRPAFAVFAEVFPHGGKAVSTTRRHASRPRRPGRWPG